MQQKPQHDKQYKERKASPLLSFRSKLPALLKLMRVDRPIGILLLLWPTLGALWVASGGFPRLDLLLIFSLGTAVMRSAGCCINDFADANIDGSVARTENRPLATGALTRRDAVSAFVVLCLIGFFLVLFTNRETIVLSFGAVVLVALYPFMKRITNLPQLVLGIAYSWGILMAFTAVGNDIPPAAYLLFIANCLWTVAYDTQYAMVDREYDLKIGVKSTAILFGDADRAMIGALQGLVLLAWWLAGTQFELGTCYYLGVGVAALLFVYHQFLIRDRLPEPCFKAFLHNNWVGVAVFAGVVLGV
jgi:4-hydroxybenzoate polyprenyltransferase